MANERATIGQTLFEKGLITEEQLRVATIEQSVTRDRLGYILVRHGAISREQLRMVLSEIDPELAIGEGSLETDIPNEVLLETQTMIAGDSGNELYISTLSEDLDMVVERLRVFVPTKKIICVAGEYGMIKSFLEETRKSTQLDVSFNTDDINDVIRKLIDNAIHDRASDIHLETGDKAVYVRYRIDGIIHIVKMLDLNLANKLFSRIKDMAGLDISEKRLPQDGGFSLPYKGRDIDFRVATLPCANGEKVTLRILDKDSVIKDTAKLGLYCIDEWKKLATFPNGIILVCGATGSGKTTTLYSTMSLLQVLNKSVYTIEDPIEYKIPFVSQVQVNRKAGLGFPEFIRTILRHDPDVVIVGEIRDKETADIALRLADTGHLVYATLHTNDVTSSITRLKGLGIDQMELSFLLRGVLVQRLVRTLCRNCGGGGCPSCKHTGYSGRSLLAEFAMMDDEHDIERIIKGEKDYHTFMKDAHLKVAMKLTDKREIERAMGAQRMIWDD